jgi:hypothetical protein
VATVTLSYQISAGVHPLVSLQTKVAGVPLLRGELDLIGMFLSSDDTTIDGSEINRTVVLETTAEGDTNFPDETALSFATKLLYRQTLALGVPATVVAADPVVAL